MPSSVTPSQTHRLTRAVRRLAGVFVLTVLLVNTSPDALAQDHETLKRYQQLIQEVERARVADLGGSTAETKDVLKRSMDELRRFKAENEGLLQPKTPFRKKAPVLRRPQAPLFTEDFNAGIPGTWTTIDNEGDGIVWDTDAFWGRANYSSDDGTLTAHVDSDVLGSGLEYDAELITPSLNLCEASSLALLFNANYQNIGATDHFEVDIDDGGGWVNVLSWAEDHPPGGLFIPPGEDVNLDISAYDGLPDVQIRFRYFDTDTNDFNWYAQIDDFVLDGMGSITTPGIPACMGPDLTVSKIVDDDEPFYNQVISFTITATNNGPGDATLVEVTDNLPGGLDFVSASASQGSYDDGTGIWDIGTLTDGASATLTIDALVTTLDPRTNSASINGDEPDGDPSNNSDSITITPRAADLYLDKVVDNDMPELGDNVTFTITIEHLDGADVTNVRVEDVLPAGLSYVSSSATQGSYNSATGAWQVGSLTEGQVETLTITVEVTSTAPITNTAFIASSSEPDPFPGDNTDAASLNAEAADLEVSKAVTGFANVGGTITATYMIEVSNEGPSDTGGVEVTDYLSPDMSVVSISVSQGATSLIGGVVTWAVGDLDDGDSATMTITVTVTEGGSLLNTAEVTASDLPDPDSEPGDGAGDDHGAATAGPRIVPDFVPGQSAGGIVDRGSRFAADLEVTKDVDVSSAASGNTVNYTITVKNLGPQSTARVEATDVLPSCLTFTSASASRGSYNETTGIWTIGSLKIDEAETLEISAEVGADCSGTVTNTAEITSSSLPDPSDFFNLFDEPPATLLNNRASASFDFSGRELVLDGTTFALGGNYPNPFNPETVIPFSIAQYTHVSINVYDLLGREVAVLVAGTLSPGVHEVTFDASLLPTGVYLVRMEAAGIVQTQRITLMK